MAKIYKHEYAPLSVYGNVVRLLRDHGPRVGAHVDVGCGYGAIAEPLRDELGLTYLGFDIADDGLISLQARGFEVRRIDVADVAGAEAIIRDCVGDRPIASLTLLDCLEHVTNGPDVVALLRRLADRHAAPLVMSVPNVAHKDIALKLLTGRWDMTEAGLLDHTHVRFYTGSSLRRLMSSLGWRESTNNDWRLEHSDQEFPATSPVLNHALPVGHFLRRLIDHANPHAIVNQFVRLYEVDRPLEQRLLEDRAEPARPLLSVMIPVHEARIERLAGLMGGLALQADHDFDVTIVVHPSQRAPEGAVNALLLNLPPGLRTRVAVIARPHESRAQALNAVLSNLAGRYVTVLGERDLPARQWCAELADLCERAPGAVLRLDGNVHPLQPGAESSFAESILPVAPEGRSSIANFAIPAGVLHELGLRFDPELEFFEWGLVVQASLLCGVAVSDVVAVSSQEPQDQDDVVRRRIALSKAGTPTVLAKLNAHPLLLPPGSAEKIRSVQAFAAALERELLKLKGKIGALQPVGALLSNYFEDMVAELVSPQDEAAGGRPFLSIITRTQGLRLRTLRDTLLSLAGQTCQDFELLIVVHAQGLSARRAVEAVVNAFPTELRQRIQVMTCTRPGRAAPLNDALVQIKGHYFAVLDDDDFVLGHWVETFRTLARDTPGALLRATTARQDFEMMESQGFDRGPRATSWFKMDWPSAYDSLAHLYTNYTPFMSMAFPVSAVRDLGLRFDESLSTTEDWDFATRTASLTGVSSSPEVTAIYRWWTNSESSLFAHDPNEWVNNRRRVIHKLDSKPLLLPPGSVTGINNLREDRAQLRGQVVVLEGQVAVLERKRKRQGDRVHELEEDCARLTGQVAVLKRKRHRERKRVHELEAFRTQLYEQALRAQLYDQSRDSLIASALAMPWPDPTGRTAAVARRVLIDVVNSRSWQCTRPLRRISTLLNGGDEARVTLENIPTSLEECQTLIQQVCASYAWRLTRPLRALMALRRHVRRT